MKIPTEIKDWIVNIFRDCNLCLSEKLSNNPNCYEEHLDQTLIEHLSRYASPIAIDKSWTVRIDTHFIGGRRHFHGWEVADIGVLVFFRKNGKILTKKVALLQSKRLYPRKGYVKEETREDMMIGISVLLPSSDENTPLSSGYTYEFDEESKYKALKKGDRQYEAISKWMSEFEIPVYYLLYNPWTLPFRQTIPLIQYETPNGECELGARIVRSTDLFRVLDSRRNDYSPSIGDLEEVSPAPDRRKANLYGWRLESFIENILNCNHGYQFSSISDPNIDQLFYRKNAMLVAAIAISIELIE